jgi:hypothetical protein
MSGVKVPTNSGDALRMAMRVGANLAGSRVVPGDYD